MVLHTWGSALTHHPHVHCVVPGGGLSLDGSHWVSCRDGFFLPVRVLSRLFRRLFLAQLDQLNQQHDLQFHGHLTPLKEEKAFAQWLQPLRQKDWVVYAKAPFSGPSAVLAYLSRYTHRVAISNQRLLSMENDQVTFRWKDYREDSQHRQKTMSLTAGEFMRRFLQHVLPKGFHRIRQYGLLANSKRAQSLMRARHWLAQDLLPDRSQVIPDPKITSPQATFFCPKCFKPLRVLALFEYHYDHGSRGPPTMKVVTV